MLTAWFYTALTATLSLGTAGIAAVSALVAAIWATFALNGLLPCGLVYTMLAVAVAAGGPAQGALLMLGFGLGTLPAMLAGTGFCNNFLFAHPFCQKHLAEGIVNFMRTGMGKVFSF